MTIRYNGSIIAGSGGGGANPDETTIDLNSEEKLEALGTVNKNTSSSIDSMYNWIGTLAEYTSQNIETLHPEWICFITDDVTTHTPPSRNLGEIVQSTIPLTDAGLHLLDGSLISSGSYSAFVDYIGDLYSTITPVVHNFTQPTLSANGTLGGDSFAVYASNNHENYPIWQAFDGNSSTNWLTDSALSSQFPVSVILYNPVAIKVTNIALTNRTSYATYATAGNVYGSNDNSTYTLISSFTNTSATTAGATWNIDLSSNSEHYKYYKIEFTSATFSNSGNFGLAEVNITATYQTLPCFCTEEEWQSSVTTYGVCGKFVYDSVNETVRLPKVAGFTEGTITTSSLGDLIQAGLPNITGSAGYAGDNGLTRTGATLTGAFKYGSSTTATVSGVNEATGCKLDFDASGSNSIYGNSTTVQPQSIKVLYYICIATTTKTEIEVDIDEIATDLNGKADVDLTNVNSSGTSLASGWSMPSNTYDELTIGAHGSIYTAPANGWFALTGATAASANSTCQMDTSEGLRAKLMGDGHTAMGCGTFIPIKANSTMELGYYNFTVSSLKFIYAEGESSN